MKANYSILSYIRVLSFWIIWNILCNREKKIANMYFISVLSFFVLRKEQEFTDSDRSLWRYSQFPTPIAWWTFNEPLSLVCMIVCIFFFSNFGRFKVMERETSKGGLERKKILITKRERLVNWVKHKLLYDILITVFTRSTRNFVFVWLLMAQSSTWMI